jgi:hypothetical protein
MLALSHVEPSNRQIRAPSGGIGCARAWGPEVRTTHMDYIIAALVRFEPSTSRRATPSRLAREAKEGAKLILGRGKVGVEFVAVG